MKTTTLDIYEDDFGRCIWLMISHSEVRMDLQDLGPNFEYERCATVKNVAALCQALNTTYDNLESHLLLMLKDQKTAFDLFTNFLDNHKIYFEYYSG